MMKKCKILGTAAAMMLVFALAGCENNTDDVDALKKRVDQMEQELADMEINNNLAESSQDKASINEVSASDDSIASLTQAVDDMVSKANEAKPDWMPTRIIWNTSTARKNFPGKNTKARIRRWKNWKINWTLPRTSWNGPSA